MCLVWSGWLVGLYADLSGFFGTGKKVLQRVHVCVVHLIDHRRLVHPFRSHAELQEHIRNDEHYFPQGRSEREGKGEGLLRVLLRTIEG